MPEQIEIPTSNEISDRLETVRQRIDAVRQPGQEVMVVAVTKSFPLELARRAIHAGVTSLGENYAQELAAKAGELEQTNPEMAESVAWHFIGGLQRNKVKLIKNTVAVWQTVDRPSLINELAKRAAGASIFIQVNATDEVQKSGCYPADVSALVDQAGEQGLDVRGLMTIGPTDGSDPRPAFDLMRKTAENLGLSELSMGMSGDFDAAVACGATMVRIGSVLFGQRRP